LRGLQKPSTQADFIVRRRNLIARVNKNPMKRAPLFDKIRLAAAVLRAYRNPNTLTEHLPTNRALSRLQAEITARAETLVQQVGTILGNRLRAITVAPCTSQVGSGAIPVETLQSAALVLRPADPSRRAVETLSADFRALPRPIIGRIHDGAPWLDLRYLDDRARVIAALKGQQL
jgi:L-seryl-tRNA(Ser) seleniumtransferase